MEYYGKILCISYHDLTYDDRPVIIDGKGDYSRSRALKDVHPSMLSEEELAPIMSEANYKQLADPGTNQCSPFKGKDSGDYALIEVATLPLRFQERIKLKYGDMKDDILRNWFGSHFHIERESPGVLLPIPFRQR